MSNRVIVTKVSEAELKPRKVRMDNMEKIRRFEKLKELTLNIDWPILYSICCDLHEYSNHKDPSDLNASDSINYFIKKVAEQCK